MSFVRGWKAASAARSLPTVSKMVSSYCFEFSLRGEKRSVFARRGFPVRHGVTRARLAGKLIGRKNQSNNTLKPAHSIVSTPCRQWYRDGLHRIRLPYAYLQHTLRTAS